MDAIIGRDPEDEFRAPDEKGVAAAVTITATISQNRQIVVQTYLDRDAPVRDFHSCLDKLSSAIERQEAKSSLQDHKTHLETEEKGLRNLQEDYLAIEERSKKAFERGNRRGQWRFTDQEQQARSAALTNVDRFKDAITKRKAEMARLEALIAEGN